MKKGLIGVIVPVYKVEKYIAECIESILAQTYTQFRLILVDDGTPDNAGNICDEYAKKDSRITVIHQENKGVTRARARGVEETNDCEFITFVDSDDTIITTYLEILKNAINEDTDIVISDFHTIFTENTEIPIEDYRHCLFSEERFSLAPWGKLFKKSLFDEFIFHIPREITVGEDMIMNIRLSFKTQKNIKITRGQIYNYRIYNENTTHSHANSIDYVQKCHKLKIASIPEDYREKYLKSTIRARLFWFREIWGYKYFVNGMRESEFYQETKSDINKYNHKLSIIDNIIFTYENAIIRFLAINIKKVQNKFQSSRFQ